MQQGENNATIEIAGLERTEWFMYHLKDIFEDKDMAFLDDDYNEFMICKNKHLADSTDDNYLELTNLYMAVDAYLKAMLSSGYLVLDEFQYIRGRLKKGL